MTRESTLRSVAPDDLPGLLAQLADAADLPTRACEHLAKAQRLTVQWLATLAFF